MSATAPDTGSDPGAGPAVRPGLPDPRDTAESATAQDLHWMRLAIETSRQALYQTAPNPRVACLIVRNNRLLASGVTQQAGGSHAEVMALREAERQGVAVQGATFYVTLEPCSHHGRTPPCVDALIAARPARVVVAMADPNPRVAGRGLSKLREAGIAVTAPVLAGAALEVNPGFVARMVRGTPWVWLKTAASLDGYTALPDGSSQWITGPQARADGHHWRARSCVVLTGLGTVQADDPLLTVRGVQSPRQPVRAVLDTRLRISEQARLLDGGPVWIFTGDDVDPAKVQRLQARNVRVIAMPCVGGRVSLPSVMRWLGEHEINEVHVEAGAELGGALLRDDCVDALLVYIAPKLLGAGRGMYALPAVPSLADAPGFEFIDAAPMGGDLRLLARQPGRWQALFDAVGGYPGNS